MCGQGLAWSVGTGKIIDLWTHKWIVHTSSLRSLIQGPLNSNKYSLKLSNFWSQEGLNGDNLSLFVPEDIRNKANTVRLHENRNDIPYWFLQSNGMFSTKTAQRLLELLDILKFKLHGVWTLNVVPKIKFFLWLCSHNRLPTNTYLHRLGVISDPSSPLCQSAIETIEDTLLECYMVRHFLFELGMNMHHIVNTPTHWLQNIYDLNVPFRESHLHWIDIFSLALWHIWLRQNHHVFWNNDKPPITLSLPLILIRVAEFIYFSNPPFKYSSDSLNF